MQRLASAGRLCLIHSNGMSTRATYQFLPDRSEFKPNVTFYIHHDGYPEGAADYFRATIARGSIGVDNFFRANARAEFTRDHEAHGDTEYRYTINPGKGTIEVRTRPDFNEGEWPISFYGKLIDFINQQPGEMVHVIANEFGHEHIGTVSQFLEKAMASRKRAEDYAREFPQFTGNIQGSHKEADRWDSILAQAQRAEPSRYVTTPV